MRTSLRIGTRGSALALYQAELVRGRILQDFRLVNIEIVPIKTTGDLGREQTPEQVETKSVFTKEIEEALLAGKIDLAVHSAKDLSVELPKGLVIGAALEREDARDCLISRDKKLLSELPMGARIGTGSLRRKMQLLRWNPELIVEDIRGNVDTRIRKMEEGLHDAIVLALAGIKRLGLEQYVTEIFPENEFLPAPGQGVIVVESREKDPELEEMLKPLRHHETQVRLAAERAFLTVLEGGCKLPCGMSTSLVNGKLAARGIIFETDDCKWVEGVFEGDEAHPEEAGRRLAQVILEQGGREILEKIRK